MTLSRTILESLARVHPYLVPERTLWQEVNLTQARPVTQTEFGQALADLESQRLVSSTRNELDQMLKWRITDNGRAALSS